MGSDVAARSGNGPALRIKGQRGGRRPGAGRPRGDGDLVATVQLRVTAAERASLVALGNGNISMVVRRLLAEAVARQEGCDQQAQASPALGSDVAARSVTPKAGRGKGEWSIVRPGSDPNATHGVHIQSVYLGPEDHASLLEWGNGNISAGVRRLVAEARDRQVGCDQ